MNLSLSMKDRVPLSHVANFPAVFRQEAGVLNVAGVARFCARFALASGGANLPRGGAAALCRRRRTRLRKFGRLGLIAGFRIARRRLFLICLARFVLLRFALLRFAVLLGFASV